MRWCEKTSYLVEKEEGNKLIGSNVAVEPQLPMIAGGEVV
jgi:hypothetical protein